MAASRKRRARGGSCAWSKSCEMVRFPSSTLLFRLEAAEAAEAVGEKAGARREVADFAFSESSVRALSGERQLRVEQWKATRQFSVLRWTDENGGLYPPPSKAEILSEAAAQGLSGALLPSDQTLAFFEPDELLSLIDDDKREGLSQQLITDMFALMSIH